MFSETKYMLYKKIHKKRVNRNIKLSYNNLLPMRVYTCRTVKLFSFHIKMLKNLFNRLVIKVRRLTIKERFRSGKRVGQINRTVIKKYDVINRKFKNIFYYLRYSELSAINLVKYKNLKLQKRQFLFFNLIFFPYTKKAIGSRMGKGVGVAKNWNTILYAGQPVFYLYNWRLVKLIYLVKQINILLPGVYRYSNNLNFLKLKNLVNLNTRLSINI